MGGGGGASHPGGQPSSHWMRGSRLRGNDGACAGTTGPCPTHGRDEVPRGHTPLLAGHEGTGNPQTRDATVPAYAGTTGVRGNDGGLHTWMRGSRLRGNDGACASAALPHTWGTLKHLDARFPPTRERRGFAGTEGGFAGRAGAIAGTGPAHMDARFPPRGNDGGCAYRCAAPYREPSNIWMRGSRLRGNDGGSRERRGLHTWMRGSRLRGNDGGSRGNDGGSRGGRGFPRGVSRCRCRGLARRGSAARSGALSKPDSTS